MDYKKAVVITGSRDWKDGKLITERLAQQHADALLIFGDCPSGADEFARVYAVQQKKPYRQFTAEWSKYGRSAGPRRNAEMLKWAKEHCEHVTVLAYPLGESRGTYNCINAAKKLGLEVVLGHKVKGFI